MRPAVFLDRDNTIIQNDDHLGDPDGVVLFDDTVDSLLRLVDAGYVLVVVTNQSGVARGLFTEEDVHAVHDTIRNQVREAAGERDLLMHWYHSPYHPEGTVEPFVLEHPTRKPEPGMLLQAAEELDLDLSSSWMIGDAPRDIRAGQKAGCRTILLRCGGWEHMKDPQPDAIVEGIGAATDFVLHT
ncbi:MAG: HAD family hydrolase [Phycisphaerales bacterium]|nr:HAD family hydrolase [Phycisphaerales bacterium]